MKELSIIESKNMYGGAGISAAIINAVTKLASTVLDAGRYVGNAIRRLHDNNICGY